MASDLQNTLNAIYSEKISKIKPENIKKGITIFDIQGEYSEVPQEVYDQAVSDKEYAEDQLVQAMTLANEINGEVI